MPAAWQLEQILQPFSISSSMLVGFFFFFLIDGFFIFIKCNVLVNLCDRKPTFPGAHSVPSRGGPFLVLQK